MSVAMGPLPEGRGGRRPTGRRLDALGGRRPYRFVLRNTDRAGDRLINHVDDRILDDRHPPVILEAK